MTSKSSKTVHQAYHCLNGVITLARTTPIARSHGCHRVRQPRGSQALCRWGTVRNAKHQVTLSSKQPNIVRRIERLSGLAFCARRFTRVRDSQLYSDGDVPHFMGMPPTCPLANTPSSLHQQYSCLIPYRSRLQMSIHLVHKESPAIRTRTAHYTSVGAISPRRRPAARGTAGTSTRARTSAQSTRRGTHARSAPPPLPRPRHGTAPDTRRTCRHAFRAA